MGTNAGDNTEKSDNTPLNLKALETTADGQSAVKTLPAQTTPADTNASNTVDTGNLKSAADLLYDIPAIQRLLRPQPKIQVSTAPASGRVTAGLAPRHTGSLVDRKAAYRRWLEQKTKEDLIELIVGLESREDVNEATRTLLRSEAEKITGEPNTAQPIPDDLPYMRLPNVRRGAPHETAPAWRFVLIALDPGSRLIGLEIDGEITIGRKSGDAIPDLDLTPFGAKTRGISRFHACLRPTATNLMLIDNDSSNGTFWNQKRLPTQTEQPLKEGDVITLGRISFAVRIVSAPTAHGAKTVL